MNISYRIRVLSDAEIGSGFGNEGINSLVVRDLQGNPVVRASHLKGVLRQILTDLLQEFEQGFEFIESLFGRAGKDGDDGREGCCRFRDATLSSAGNVRTITRTSLNEFGTAGDGTLRTSEAVSAGSEFEGGIRVLLNANALQTKALQMGLLSLEALGGNRNRGAGACLITLDATDDLTPGALLLEIAEGLREWTVNDDHRTMAMKKAKSAEEASTWIRIRFEAMGPVCCPGLPARTESNVVQSGIVIPASAVWGGLLTKVSESDPALASETLFDRKSRVWPLQPSGMTTCEGAGLPVRIPASHKVSKLKDHEGNYEFQDASIKHYEWQKVNSSSPLKGADGVLIPNGEIVTLWKSGDMPRILSTHAVHFPESNLFSIESLAPMCFEGLAHVSARFAAALKDCLKKDDEVSFGKSRTVRGGGRLSVEEVSVEHLFGNSEKRVWILQSPASIPDDWDMKYARSEKALERLVRESGLGPLKELDLQEGSLVQVRTLAACGVQFGWNRHGVGKRASLGNHLQGRRVFLPGSVFVLEEAPEHLEEVLLRGLGVEDGEDIDGRIRGFGALLPHPGLANEVYECKPEPEHRRSTSSGKLALQWHLACGGAPPSPSQIAAVAQRITPTSGQEALSYLKNQNERSERIWAKWSNVIQMITDEILRDPDVAKAALRTWQDIAVNQRKEKEALA